MNQHRHSRAGRPVPAAAVAAALLGTAPITAPAVADAADTMHLTDEPGNWFRSDATGTPLAVVDVGETVDFRIGNCCTNTRHTVTLLVRPDGSAVEMDQDHSQHGTLSLTLDVAGVYILVCKIHPYMTAVVAVRDGTGAIPDVTAGALPFIGHLGLKSLPALDVLSVVTTVAPTEEDKLAKWDILGPDDELIPPVPGVGEVWVSSQFERVPGQVDEGGVSKPGTITVVDAATFSVEREIDGLAAGGLWNNPHNMWANFALDTIYNGNWFGKWVNKIDRESGAIEDTVTVGEAPTHIITVPTPGSDELGVLTVPLSADDDIVKVRDDASGLVTVDSLPTGEGRNHPHGHWLTCGAGDRMVVPNVFKGLGLSGSVSVIDTLSGEILAEFGHSSDDPLRSALLMPIAAGQCHVDGVSKAYVANLVSGMVTVIDVDRLCILGNIPVTLTPDGHGGLGLLHTLQAPIQTPVSPDERWVATAVLSLTTIRRGATGSPDHVAIIDTRTDQVVAMVPSPAGTHGVNWGSRLGGGYYAYVTSQHANVLTVIDPDPDADGDGSDAAAVGTILLANGSRGAGVTDGTGGQGVKPIPMTHDGWIQRTVELSGTGALSDEVEGWIALLTDAQRNPQDAHIPPIPGDLDQDGMVGIVDLLLLLAAWGTSGPGDLDADCAVGVGDLLVLLANWG
jgi:DNA-binding beta-propeller fold protein YncE/plastocyanin